jgi:hypothetical protein
MSYRETSFPVRCWYASVSLVISHFFTTVAPRILSLRWKELLKLFGDEFPWHNYRRCMFFGWKSRRHVNFIFLLAVVCIISYLLFRCAKWKNYERHYWERNLTINVRWPWISTRHRWTVALRCSSLVVLGSDLATGVANKRNRLAFLTWANKYFVFTNTFISRPSMPL